MSRHGRFTQHGARWWWELIEVPLLVAALMVLGLAAYLLMGSLT